MSSNFNRLMHGTASDAAYALDDECTIDELRVGLRNALNRIDRLERLVTPLENPGLVTEED